MLYTLSRADSDLNHLTAILDNISENDAVLLWQDGVLQAVKNPQFFAKFPNLFVLQPDLQARGLDCDFKKINLAKLVELTENYFPQFAL